MKKLERILLTPATVFALCCGLIAAPLIVGLQGCAGTPNRIAYQGAVIQRTSVELALGLFNEWVKAKKAQGVDTTSTQLKVQDAFNKWKDATIVALEAGRLNSVGISTNAAGQTGIAAAFQDALNNSAALKAELLQLILDLGIKIPGTTSPAAFTPVK